MLLQDGTARESCSVLFRAIRTTLYENTPIRKAAYTAFQKAACTASKKTAVSCPKDRGLSCKRPRSFAEETAVIFRPLCTLTDYKQNSPLSLQSIINYGLQITICYSAHGRGRYIQRAASLSRSTFSATMRWSMQSCICPSRKADKLCMVYPMRWSVTRPCGKL